MTDLTPNHPAVEAAARATYERAWCGEGERWAEVDDLERYEWRADEVHSLNAALPHLTADDLRNTPAGRKLMAEGWKAALVQLEALAQTYNDKRDHLMAGDLLFAHERIARHNPYLEGDA